MGHEAEVELYTKSGPEKKDFFLIGWIFFVIVVINFVFVLSHG